MGGGHASVPGTALAHGALGMTTVAAVAMALGAVAVPAPANEVAAEQAVGLATVCATAMATCGSVAAAWLAGAMSASMLWLVPMLLCVLKCAAPRWPEQVKGPSATAVGAACWCWCWLWWACLLS